MNTGEFSHTDYDVLFSDDEWKRLNVNTKEDTVAAKEIIFNVVPILEGKTVKQTEMAFKRILQLLRDHNAINFPVSH